MERAIKDEISDELIPKEKDFLDNTRTVLAEQLEKATLFGEWGRLDLAKRMGHEIEEQLITKRRIEAHIHALESLSEDDQLTLNPDYKSLLEEKTSHYLSQRFDTKEQEEYRNFSACIQQFENTEEAVDEDFEMTEDLDQIAPNDRCPLSGRTLENIVDPVVDSSGYVYEKAEIERYLAMNGRGIYKEIECPVAGTSHIISTSSLLPAVRVKRALKKKRTRSEAENSTPVL